MLNSSHDIDNEIVDRIYGHGININNEVVVHLTDIENTSFGMSTSLERANSLFSRFKNNMNGFFSPRKVAILNFITDEPERKQAYIKIFQMKTLSEAIERNSIVYIIIEPCFDMIITELIMDLYKGKANILSPVSSLK